jgi:hypothetical protein
MLYPMVLMLLLSVWAIALFAQALPVECADDAARAGIETGRPFIAR